MAIGCDSTSPYRTVLREQTKAIEDLAAILETVRDKSSMQAARAQLSARLADYDRIQQRAVALPPPDQETMRQLQDDGEKIGLAVQKILDQCRRIGAIPGGAEFIYDLGNMHGLLGDFTP